MTAAAARPERLRFRPGHRLTHKREFQAVFDAGLRHASGPLTVHARPARGDRPRLGLSIGRRVGGAVVRNRLKRRLREAFRLMQHDFPEPYDVVITARRHEPLRLAEYQDLLARCVRTIHQKHASRRSDRSDDRPPRG